MLIGVLEPIHLEIISEYPANSTTARTGPPAIIPVPCDAGLINTCPEPNLPSTSWGIVPWIFGTLIIFLLAASDAFLIASGTSFALPVPNPTRPFLSPITTNAAKRNLRPPLTTLVTRLIVTTRS